jgi:hypothetical protein
MIEILPLSPSNEVPIAQRLARLILNEWPDLERSPAGDLVRIFIGARFLFEVDLLVAISLQQPRPVESVTLRGNRTAPSASLTTALLAIEVKQAGREHFEIFGTEIFPRYGTKTSRRSVGEQIADSVMAVRNFVGRYTNERIFVHGLGWLTDVPETELATMPDYIVGSAATWPAVMQAAATRSSVLFDDPGEPYRAAVRSIGDLLARKRRLPPVDRAAVDRLTNAVIADGQMDTIRAALGSKQIRLAGRAGSGKSTTLALIAEEIARVRQERLLVLTYHHALCHEIERLIRSVVKDDALVDRHVRVATLVDFLADACDELGGAIPIKDGAVDYANVEKAFGELTRSGTTEALAADARVLEEIEADRFGFDYVCIDEAQDCLDAERDMLRLLYPPLRTILADGLEQLVRRQTPCDWTAGVPRNERLNVELPESLRMSRNVAEFATAAAREMGFAGWRIKPHPQLAGGRIDVHDGPYDREFLETLIASVDALEVARKDLLICVPPSEVLKDGISRDCKVAREVRSWGYEVWNGCDDAVRRGEPADLGAIRIVQYDSMRGLEGWCTLLVGLDAFYAHRLKYPHLTEGDRCSAEDVAKRWLLMALTRAAQVLAVTLDDPNSEVASWIHAAAAAMPEGVAQG